MYDESYLEEGDPKWLPAIGRYWPEKQCHLRRLHDAHIWSVGFSDYRRCPGREAKTIEVRDELI